MAKSGELSVAQIRLLNRIIELSNQEQTKAEASNQHFCGWIREGDLCSKDYGYRKVTLPSVKALVAHGAIHLEITSSVRDSSNKYQFGLGTIYRTVSESNYRFKLTKDGESATTKYIKVTQPELRNK